MDSIQSTAVGARCHPAHRRCFQLGTLGHRRAEQRRIAGVGNSFIRQHPLNVRCGPREGRCGGNFIFNFILQRVENLHFYQLDSHAVAVAATGWIHIVGNIAKGDLEVPAIYAVADGTSRAVKLDTHKITRLDLIHRVPSGRSELVKIAVVSTSHPEIS